MLLHALGRYGSETRLARDRSITGCVLSLDDCQSIIIAVVGAR